MKKYTNTEQMLAPVVFEGVTQFLRRGEFIVTDLVALNVPEGVVITEVDEKIDSLDKTVISKKKPK